MPTPPSVPFFERHPSKWMTSSNWALLMRNCLRYLAMPWVWEKQSRGVFFPPVNRHGIWKAPIGSSNDFPIYGIWKPLFIGDCQFPCLIARGCLRCTENFNQTQFWAEKKTWKVTISIDVASHSHDMPWLHPRVFFFVGETADSPSPSSSPWKLYIMTSLHLFLTQITLQQTNIDVYNPWFSSKNDLLKWLFLLHVRREWMLIV